VFEMRAKPDEENVDEAHRAAFRAYPFSQLPSEIADLLAAPHLESVTGASPVFDRLLAALKAFVAAHGVLPLSAALPDMHADTATYVRLQTLYKAQANAEREELRKLVVGDVDDALLDAFVKNAHALRVLDGQRFGALDADPAAVGAPPSPASPCAGAERRQRTRSRARRTRASRSRTLRSPRSPRSAPRSRCSPSCRKRSTRSSAPRARTCPRTRSPTASASCASISCF
jgi:amyloid beta precursor protein binding protein 1